MHGLSENVAGYRSGLTEHIGWSNEQREEFQKTMDKSFDLLSHYFERVKKGEPAAKKAAPKKRAPAKKKPATEAAAE